MTKSYEELMGAIGRAMFFRPERRRVRDLLSRDARPSARIGGQSYELYDISMNGLSFVDPAAPAVWRPDDELDVSVTLHGRTVYAGRARVARIEQSRASARVALALATGFLDLPAMRWQDEEGRLDRELHGGAAGAYDAVPKSYVEVMARAVHFLQFHRHSLDRHEVRLRSEGARGRAEIQPLVERACDALRPEWTAIDREASRIAMSFAESPVQSRAAHEYTTRIITPLLMASPIVERSFNKPLGYPGDFRVMIYCYDNGYEGESVFARVFHKLIVEHPLASGIRTRRDLIVSNMIAELARVRRDHGDRMYRCASLGSGPAREIGDFIAQQQRWSGEIAWTLVDQEEQALSVAYHAGRRDLQANESRGSVQCLNLAFAQILLEPSLMKAMPEQDYIYCTGLFDYLRESRARTLVEALFDRLAPGGLLAIGNAIAPNEWLWTTEYLLDWTLLFRTSDEMRRLALSLPPTAKVDVVIEPGEVYYFLLVRKA